MEDCCARFVSYALDNVLNAPLVPGVMDVLERWHGRVPMYVCSGTPQEELQSVLEQRGLARTSPASAGRPPPRRNCSRALSARNASIPPTRSWSRRHHGQRRRRSRRDAVLRARPLLREYRLPPRFRSDRTQPLAGRARGEGIRDWRGKGKLSEEGPPTFPFPLQTARGARSTPIPVQRLSPLSNPCRPPSLWIQASVPASGLESLKTGLGHPKTKIRFPPPKLLCFGGVCVFMGNTFSRNQPGEEGA